MTTMCMLLSMDKWHMKFSIMLVHGAECCCNVDMQVGVNQHKHVSPPPSCAYFTTVDPSNAPVHMCAVVQDDFFILDTHLIVTETSNSVLDARVWEAVVPQAALSWQRVLVANWLSNTGADWANWVSQYNSGEMPVELLRLEVWQNLFGLRN